MSDSDLEDFEPEASFSFYAEGIYVELEKAGGGTIGNAYTGAWRYKVYRIDKKNGNNKTEIERGQDLVTHIPKTHQSAAIELSTSYYNGESSL